MEIHFSHVLGILWISASPEIFKKPINLKCLYFPIPFPYYGNPLLPCCNIPTNMGIGIRLKIDASGLQQKCFSGYFLQLLELRLLTTHMGGSFQRVHLQNICKVSRKNHCHGVLLKLSCLKT